MQTIIIIFEVSCVNNLVMTFVSLIIVILFCSCSVENNNDISSVINNSTVESVLQIDGVSGTIKYTVIESKKGYRIGYDADNFEYKSGEKDVFLSKENGSSLEVYLSGGKTVDNISDEYIDALKKDGYSVTDPDSIAIGTEFYSSVYIRAEKEGEKKECYFIPVENECLVMIYDIKGDDGDVLLAMIETLTIK